MNKYEVVFNYQGERSVMTTVGMSGNQLKANWNMQ